ncbi:porin [Comamonas nitrativorans]|uniref:Porin n=1 Tax=Comamonas nitrativorans TaxID=108437 RepID=A0ABV9GUR6_9BURK
MKTVVVAAMAACGMGAALAQSTPSKVELWGVVDAAVRHTTNEGADKSGLTKMIGGGMSQSRFGINVEEDLGGGSKAIAHLEHRFNADTGMKDTTAPFFQLAYVGLQGPYGRLTMGRQWNVLFDVVTSTYASFPYSPYMDAYKPELGMAAGARTSNALKYTLATPDRKWVGTLQYSFGEKNNTKPVQDFAFRADQLGAYGINANTYVFHPVTGAATGAHGAIQTAILNNADQVGTTPLKQTVEDVGMGAMKTFGGFLRYSANGLSLGAGALRTKLPGGSNLDAYTLGGSYRTGPWYFNAGYGLNKFKPVGTGNTAGSYVNYLTDRQILNKMWSGQTNGGFYGGYFENGADKRQMFKVGFGYQATKQLNLGAHFFRAKQSGSSDGGDNGNANFMVVAADYAFSKRTDAYAAIDYTKVSGGDRLVIDRISKAKTRTGITVGLRHRF